MDRLCGEEKQIKFYDRESSIKFLTASSQLQLSGGLCAFLVVLNHTLIHSLVLLLDRLDSQDGIGVVDEFSVLHPSHRLDGVSGEVAREERWSAEVDGLHGWLDGG